MLKERCKNDKVLSANQFKVEGYKFLSKFVNLALNVSVKVKSRLICQLLVQEKLENLSN